MNKEKTDSTGYNPEVDEPGEVKWSAQRAGRFYATKPVAQVLRNGESRGLIFCENEEELAWIIKRLTTQEQVQSEKKKPSE